ncbi:dTDP-glucose 4,6-dehydratase [Ferviditalea candida]|uniref:dTDP-glucose 4,6-dehydratase n=1 Tax=Ferviditalea candida TaxID=3108399 RepID=A0ABU5ZD54_9BACL|nr:dTDP-glucose 4,6-dehydratase [Paenibacillaceae bacterium T2]
MERWNADRETKILVTGGMGFIGSNFILYMLEQYPRMMIYNLDALTYAGNADNLSHIGSHPKYRFVQGDIGDRKLVESVMDEGIGAVVHFAAESHVDRSIRNPVPFIRTNVNGTQCLLEAARKRGVGKFVHVSSDEVYGTLGEQGFFTEDSPLAPNSPYSASKASSDLIARAYFRTFGFPVVVTRCSNNYGPRQFPEKLIPMMIEQAMTDSPIPLYGDGLNVRDWIHVEDHCRAIDIVMQGGKPGDVYNVGGNNERTNLEVARIVLSQLGKPESLIQFVDDRPGHDRRYAIKAEKIRKQLNWSARYSFEQGIKQTVEWYLQNPEWLRRIRSGEYLHTHPQYNKGGTVG